MMRISTLTPLPLNNTAKQNKPYQASYNTTPQLNVNSASQQTFGRMNNPLPLLIMGLAAAAGFLQSCGSRAPFYEGMENLGVSIKDAAIPNVKLSIVPPDVAAKDLPTWMSTKNETIGFQTIGKDTYINLKRGDKLSIKPHELPDTMLNQTFYVTHEGKGTKDLTLDYGKNGIMRSGTDITIFAQGQNIDGGYLVLSPKGGNYAKGDDFETGEPFMTYTSEETSGWDVYGAEQQRIVPIKDLLSDTPEEMMDWFLNRNVTPYQATRHAYSDGKVTVVAVRRKHATPDAWNKVNLSNLAKTLSKLPPLFRRSEYYFDTDRFTGNAKGYYEEHYDRRLDYLSSMKSLKPVKVHEAELTPTKLKAIPKAVLPTPISKEDLPLGLTTTKDSVLIRKTPTAYTIYVPEGDEMQLNPALINEDNIVVEPPDGYAKAKLVLGLKGPDGKPTPLQKNQTVTIHTRTDNEGRLKVNLNQLKPNRDTLGRDTLGENGETVRLTRNFDPSSKQLIYYVEDLANQPDNNGRYPNSTGLTVVVNRSRKVWQRVLTDELTNDFQTFFNPVGFLPKAKRANTIANYNKAEQTPISPFMPPTQSTSKDSLPAWLTIDNDNIFYNSIGGHHFIYPQGNQQVSINLNEINHAYKNGSTSERIILVAPPEGSAEVNVRTDNNSKALSSLVDIAIVRQQGSGEINLTGLDTIANTQTDSTSTSKTVTEPQPPEQSRHPLGIDPFKDLLPTNVVQIIRQQEVPDTFKMWQSNELTYPVLGALNVAEFFLPDLDLPFGMLRFGDLIPWFKAIERKTYDIRRNLVKQPDKPKKD